MSYPLLKQISFFEELLSKDDVSNKAVSEGSIYWHIDHCLRVIIGVSIQLQRSKADEYKWSFNWKRIVMFFKKDFPRGKAKAPKKVVVQGELSKEEILRLLSKVKKHLIAFEALDSKQFVIHHIIGVLKKSNALRFLRIHTDHHIEIIKDILKT